jgi:hypothetical protein
MLRHRVIAAAPARPATQTWQTITRLIADTLDRSSSIDRSDVMAALNKAEPAGLMLIAGGHLEQQPLTLVAAPIHLEITTVSGVDALREDEDVEPVVGGASATGWHLYFPTPEPVGPAIKKIVASIACLTTATPPCSTDAHASKSASLISAAGLERLAQERRS